MFDYWKAKCGDYIDRHASAIVDILGVSRTLAEVIIKVNISRGHADDDLAKQIVKQCRDSPIMFPFICRPLKINNKV